MQWGKVRSILGGMSTQPKVWRNRCPGDLSVELPEISASDVDAEVLRSQDAFRAWRALSLDQRKAALRESRSQLEAKQEELAQLIALEMGKPLREARLELGAVIAKFDLTFADADLHIADHPVLDGPHPALIRRRPRGPAAVIAPFNFPIHLGHGATVAYLLAGNTVLFKPSPLAANVGAAYAIAMQSALPAGVFQLVQGGGDVGHELCLHKAVRSVCFTGSVPVGRALAGELAADYSKSLALELGGKNSLFVLADADLDRAAGAAADGMCLTTGQRCNATSRILLHESIEDAFVKKFLASLERYQPGDPRLESTTLGPLVSEAALTRFENILKTPGKWLCRGDVCAEVDGRRGYYVRPAVLRTNERDALGHQESFSPVVTIETFSNLAEAAACHESVAYGLTASIFTSSEESFSGLGQCLNVGNLYRNLPTTFSPSTLPFGGLGASGNGKPGARGFVRFAADEQAVQWQE